MTVAELIEALGMVDPSLEIVMPSRTRAGFAQPARVFLDTIARSPDGSWQLCDYTDDGCTMVARLFESSDFDDRRQRPKLVMN